MEIPKITFILFITAYWLLVRIPLIIGKKRRQKPVEKEKLKIVGELPLFLSILFYILAICLVIPKSLDLWPFLIGMTLIVSGTLFNEWARKLLGKQWSGSARIVQDHELITKGPYSIVRHPMYFANMVMLLGCLLVVRSYALFGLAALISGLLIYRARIEEQELDNKFDKGYLDYRKKVALIIPFIY